MKRYFLIILMLIFLFFNIMSGSCAAEQEEFHWVTQTCHPLVGPNWEYVYELWADKVMAMSGGRLTMDLHAEGEIVPGADVYAAVRDGLLDAGVNSPGYNVGRFPAMNMLTTSPGGLVGFHDLVVWYYGGEGNNLVQELYGDEVVVFQLGMTPPESFWTNKKIESLDDIQGMKFRSAGIAMEFWDKLGASTIMIPGGEIVPGLQRNLLDATDYLDPYMDYSLGLHEVADFIVGPGLHAANNNYQLIVNPKSWEALPDDLKEIVKNAAIAATFEGYAEWWVKSAEYFKKIKDAGVTPLRLSKDIQQKAAEVAKEVMNEEAKRDEWSQRMWDSLRASIEMVRPYYDFSRFDADVN